MMPTRRAWVGRLRRRLYSPSIFKLGARLTPAAIKSGLQRRLLLLLLLPLGIFALTSIYFDYQTASNVARQKDQQLLRLVPLLADSIVAPGLAKGSAPVLLMAPEIEVFIKNRADSAAFRISDSEGNFLVGEAWIVGVVPPTSEPEFHSMEADGITYRIVAQRVETVAGKLIVQLADGTDARQQWMRSLWLKVLLPNLLLVLAVGFAVNWAVNRALRPLIELKEAVERRSPRDLSAIDPLTTPAEVQPLVSALNRLFGLVNDQAEGQRRFVADAAHQLRTPLAGLQAQVEAWAQAAGSDGTLRLPADKIIKLRSATRRTSQLANQLLALSRADAATAAAQTMQRVDLKELCESVLPEHLDAATEKGMDLGLEAEPAVACGHAWLLRELLGNLVDNAVKYTPPGGSVTIRCGTEARRESRSAVLGSAQADVLDSTNAEPEFSVFLEVVDDGPGIARAERAKALQRFYRVQGTAGEGNGLGLAIADEIARVHRSQLELSYVNEACDQDDSDPCGLRVRLTLEGSVAQVPDINPDASL
jgi:two-component system sensor histidine kinase TctE